MKNNTGDIKAEAAVNFKTVMRVLQVAGIILTILYFFILKGSIRNGAGIILAGIITALFINALIYAAKPGLFKNK